MYYTSPLPCQQRRQPPPHQPPAPTDAAAAANVTTTTTTTTARSSVAAWAAGTAIACAVATVLAVAQPVAADDAFVNSTACFSIETTAVCTPWPAYVQDFRLPALAKWMASLGSSVSDAASFDAAIQSLNFASSWPTSFGCKNLSVSNNAGVFPVRFAESYACASTIVNAVRGSSATDCISQADAKAVPSLCKETCLAFSSSFGQLRSNAAVCSSGANIDAGQNAAYVTENTTLAAICSPLPSVNDLVNGRPTCVSYTFRDFASCGFGNTTAGLTAATAYCNAQSTKDACCSYIGAPPNVVARVLGYTGASGTLPGSEGTSSATPILIGSLVGAVAIVAIAATAAYFLYRRKRMAYGRGGFVGADGSGGEETELETKTGIVVGARSRLSFLPQRGVHFGGGPSSPPGAGLRSGISPVLGNNGGYAPMGGSAGPSTLSRKLGPNASAESPLSPTLSRKLGPNASS
ncbi:hypothetical protein DFJ73DRAFT_763599 [Zopfochytrium polystomum]|nr:hypothetical protein DFJ73DRAFT_763599 [Zopfochytrium polystomum]